MELILLGVGGAIVIAIVVATYLLNRAHKNEARTTAAASEPTDPPEPQPVAPPPVLNPITEAVAREYHEATVAEIERFKAELKATTGQLHDRLAHMSDEILRDELKDFRNELTAHKQAVGEELDKLQGDIKQESAELRSGVHDRLVVLQKQLEDQLTENISRIAVAYIMESLGEGADLGAQKRHLLSTLEHNKSKLKKDIGK